MLDVQTLRKDDDGQYPEPDGEIIEVLRHSERTGTLKLLVRVDPAYYPETIQPAFDPGQLSVADIREVLDENEFSTVELLKAKEMEQNTDDRVTAVEAIESEIDADERIIVNESDCDPHAVRVHEMGDGEGHRS